MLFASAAITSCKDNPMSDDPLAQRTVFVFMPWTGDITSYLYQNVQDLEGVIAENGLDNQRVMVYFATSATEATLFEICPGNGSTTRSIIKQYTDLDVTTTNGIATVFADMKSEAPAYSYSLIIGCHGFGWILKDDYAKRRDMLRSITRQNDAGALTRFFGGNAYSAQIDITDFVEGINQTGMHFAYIVFDDCYMASVEAVYEMRNITDCVLASPSEVMAAGIPYAKVGNYLLGKENLKAVCDGFLSFYKSYSLPYGILTVVDCTQLDELAAVMKSINNSTTITDTESLTIQKYDYLNPPVFFDMADYVNQLTEGNTTLRDTFKKALAAAVPYEVHTDYYYTQKSGRAELSTCCGLTISDPSTNVIAASKESTSWWKATH